MESIEITCLTPVRMRYNLLYEAYKCFKSQSIKSKWLIVSEGPEDCISKEIKDFPNIYTEFVAEKYFRNLGGLRNYLLSQVETPYYAFIDSDDLFSPKRLEIQLNWLKDHPDKEVCILRNYILIDSDYKVRGAGATSAAYGTIMGRTNALPSVPCLSNTSSAEFNGYFRERLWNGDESSHIFTESPLWAYMRTFDDKPHYQMSRREKDIYKKDIWI